MTPTRIVQIVPRLESAVDGVADYAKVLGSALYASEGLPTWFLGGNPNDNPGAEWWRDRSSIVSERSSRGVISSLEAIASGHGLCLSPTIFLHYANYGYARRGCPFWLIGGLREWKRRHPDARLVTMFHELYAFGPPWRSSFWLSPAQRFVAARLWKLSDSGVTSLARNKRRLSKWASGRDAQLATLPVFSSIGEPTDLTPWSQRAARLVVFGGPGAARRVYERSVEALAKACRALEIEEIVDIGPRDASVPRNVGGVKVIVRGVRPANEVSESLQRARAGFLSYPSDYLCKSTIFAAYAAHGVVPVVSSRRSGTEKGLTDGVNLWAVSRNGRPSSDFESLATAAQSWYAEHSLTEQVREFARKLRGISP